MNKDTVRQTVVVLATLATIAVNFLANALPLNGLNTGQISDSFNVYFVPAGYVFSIWGLIYVALIAYSIYQALPSQRENPQLRSIGYIYVLASAANIAWIFFWHYQIFGATIVAMLTLLLSLIAIYLRLDIGRQRAELAQRWTVNIPFSIYLGWITVATIANVTDVLDYVGWGGFGIAPQTWAAIMIAVGTLVTIAVSLTRGDIAYVAVIVWAFVGIGAKFPETLTVADAAWLGAGASAISLAAGVPLYLQRLEPKAEAEAPEPDDTDSEG
ncbi:MAG: TspO/MBR family protein [Anaerolineae bacterium]